VLLYSVQFTSVGRGPESCLVKGLFRTSWGIFFFWFLFALLIVSRDPLRPRGGAVVMERLGQVQGLVDCREAARLRRTGARRVPLRLA